LSDVRVAFAALWLLAGIYTAAAIVLEFRRLQAQSARRRLRPLPAP
jgi:hypothetical protein